MILSNRSWLSGSSWCWSTHQTCTNTARSCKTSRTILKTHARVHTHRSNLTLFMSSDMSSLGWAVLTSRVTSTVERREKEGMIVFTDVWVLQHCCEVSNLNTPAASSSLQKHVAKTLWCTSSFFIVSAHWFDWWFKVVLKWTLTGLWLHWTDFHCCHGKTCRDK